ncbi:MAG: ATP-binding protein [Oscillospiraceae bacterium]|nr:ATP-binding protein [Oscillospiraceae bacterium]
MENTTLLSLSAENFASFAECATFTTVIEAGKKEHMENTFKRGDHTLNKVSVLYGANGSGKTFFCKILREIQRILEWSPICVAVNNPQLLAIPEIKGMDSSVSKFAFDTAYKDKPSCFAISINLGETTYSYSFCIHGKKIVSELLTKKYRRTEKILERTSPSFKDISLRSELKGFESAKHIVNEEALCLPVAAIFNNEFANKVVSAITNIQVISMTAAKIHPAETKESFSISRREKYVNILKKADPTIRNLNISFEEEEVASQNIALDDFENREIITKKTTVGVGTEHAIYTDGIEMEPVPMRFFADESLGTIKLFTALPHLFDTLEHGGVLVVDEIENGLHLSLAKEIIGLFINPESNPNNAQLICTSHQPLLVSENFRRDQVWVVSKDDYGKSSLHRMSSLKSSNAKAGLTNRILEGAFGCNPESFFDNT